MGNISSEKKLWKPQSIKQITTISKIHKNDAKKSTLKLNPMSQPNCFDYYKLSGSKILDISVPKTPRSPETSDSITLTGCNSSINNVEKQLAIRKKNVETPMKFTVKDKTDLDRLKCKLFGAMDQYLTSQNVNRLYSYSKGSYAHYTHHGARYNCERILHPTSFTEIEATYLTYTIPATKGINNILKKLRTSTIKDMNCIAQIKMWTGYGSEYAMLWETIPGSIFKQLQVFYNNDTYDIPLSVFKHGYISSYKNCTIQIKLKSGCEKELFPLFIDEYVNINSRELNCESPIHQLQKLAFHKRTVDNTTQLMVHGVDTPVYAFIPSHKIVNVQLVINTNTYLDLKYTPDGLIPLVNNPITYRDYSDYGFNFNMVDTLELKFDVPTGVTYTKEDIECYVICANLLVLNCEYLGLLYDASH